MEICKQQSEIKIRHCRVPRLSDTRYSANGTEQEERYSRVPRLSDTRYSRKNAIVEYLGYQIPVTYEMEICKQQSEIEMRHLPAVARFKRYRR